MINYSIIASNLRQARLGQGITKEDVSNLVNIPSKTLELYENGERTDQISLMLLADLCSAYNISLNEILR